jgi:hypothetical protein
MTENRLLCELLPSPFGPLALLWREGEEGPRGPPHLPLEPAEERKGCSPGDLSGGSRGSTLCHRAVRSAGAMGGYQGGAPMKRALRRWRGGCRLQDGS